MYTAVIIEDDLFHVSILSDLLASDYPEINLLGVGCNSSEGVSLVKNRKPDIIFLDIDLPGKTGFEMLSYLEPGNHDIIFVTSHEKYAYEAHTYESVGFILKPVTRYQLDQALLKLNTKRSRLGERVSPNNLLNLVRHSIEVPDKIAIPSAKDINYVKISDIIRIEADGNYSTLHLAGKATILSSKQIGEYEDKLVSRSFLRIHDKHLVNLRFVKSFQKGDSGTAVLEDNTILPVARRRKDEFIRKMGDLFIL